MSRDFPGAASNYLNVGDVAAVDIVGTALTVAAWVKPDTNGSGTADVICAKSDNTATGIQWQLYMDGTTKFFIGSAAGFDTPGTGSALATGVWTHVAGVKNGTGAGAIALYLNGILNVSATSNLVIQNTAHAVRIGNRQSNDLHYDGAIAEVAIWDAALTPAELAALARGVSPLFIRRDHLKGYWPIFGIGSPEPDLSGNGNHATIVGSLPVVAHAPVGRLAPFRG